MKNLKTVFILSAFGLLIALASCNQKENSLKSFESKQTENSERVGLNDTVGILVMYKQSTPSDVTLEILSASTHDTLTNIPSYDTTVYMGGYYQNFKYFKISNIYTKRFANNNNELLFKVNTTVLDTMYISISLNDNGEYWFYQYDIPSFSYVENKYYMETRFWFDNNFDDGPTNPPGEQGNM